MTEAHQLLDAYAAEYLDPEGECDHDCDDSCEEAAPKAFAALRAVLDLHPIVAINATYGDDRLYCYGCKDSEGEQVRWPCPTVQVITRELEREGDSG